MSAPVPTEQRSLRPGLPTVEQVVALPVGSHQVAPAEWEDLNGHVNVTAYYSFHMSSTSEALRAMGWSEDYVHRTGHSLSPGPLVHGVGMSLDNLETRDTRQMLPGIGFTIEPGAYLPEEIVPGPRGPIRGFGVRNEINVYVDPQRGPVVTSGSQVEPVWLG